MADGEQSGAEPRADPVQIGAVAEAFMRQGEFARAETIRLANKLDHQYAALGFQTQELAAIRAERDDAQRQAANLEQALRSRDAVIAERDAEIARLKEAAVVVRMARKAK